MNLRLTQKFVFALCVFISACSAPETSIEQWIEADSLTDIKRILDKESDQETLVIFDVDDVLIAPTDEFAFREPIRKKLVRAPQRATLVASRRVFIHSLTMNSGYINLAF